MTDGNVPASTARSKWRFLLPLAMFLALAALLYVGLSLNPREVPSPLVGKPAPHF